GVVAVGQAVEHAFRALGAAVAWVGAKACERHRAEPLQLARRGVDQQADLPVTRVIAQRHRPAVRRAHSAPGAEDEERFPARLAGIPGHPGILRQAENIAARTFAEHFLGERQPAGWPGGFGLDLEDLFAFMEDACEYTHASRG